MNFQNISVFCIIFVSGFVSSRKLINENCRVKLVENKVLVGFVKSVEAVKDFAECRKSCIDARASLVFRCLSGSYYVSTKEEYNCVLNSSDRNREPDHFVDSTDEGERVIYFEPGC